MGILLSQEALKCPWLWEGPHSSYLLPLSTAFWRIWLHCYLPPHLHPCTRTERGSNLHHSGSQWDLQLFLLPFLQTISLTGSSAVRTLSSRGRQGLPAFGLWSGLWWVEESGIQRGRVGLTRERLRLPGRRSLFKVEKWIIIISTSAHLLPCCLGWGSLMPESS